ncbi:polysaccharide pyruvyl transferase family protein [Stutzerimonas azotifigens]|uniref:polysaccharide pyruvyl transferase family protein n=1 Tax=Stutzerimonas azotifigens TaxID=291995 RepID=UPI000A0538FC|nr:polysaccharide pyruvyl transferase family protein [Stutzerimonas azotifigens]
MKRELVAGGYYGMGNFGDDLFGVTVAGASAHYWTDFNVRLLCPRLDGIENDFFIPGWFPKTVYSSQSYAGKLSRLGFLMRSLKEAEKYVFAGGSVFSSMPSGLRDFVVSRHSEQLAISAVGVSLGPFDSMESEKKIRTMLRSFEYISLRDKVSYEIAESFNLDARVVLAGDLAGVMKTIYPLPPTAAFKLTSDKKIIGFSPCFLDRRPELARHYCDAFISAVKAASTTMQMKVIVLNLNYHPTLGDNSLCNYAMSELNSFAIECEMICYSSMGVLGTWNLISTFDAYISVRLHGAISAFLLNVPFCLFEYHPKCTDFLYEIGAPDIARLAPEKGDDFGLTDALANILGGAHYSTLSTSKYEQASALNFTKAPWAKRNAL